MSKIEREMIAEARAEREAQKRRKEAEDIGADVPSAPEYYPGHPLAELLEGFWDFALSSAPDPQQRTLESFIPPGWNCLCLFAYAKCMCGKTKHG